MTTKSVLKEKKGNFFGFKKVFEEKEWQRQREGIRSVKNRYFNSEMTSVFCLMMDGNGSVTRRDDRVRLKR